MRSTDLYYMEQYIIGHISRSTANIKNSFTVLWWPIQLGFKFLKDILIILSLKVISFKFVVNFQARFAKFLKDFWFWLSAPNSGFFYLLYRSLYLKKDYAVKMVSNAIPSLKSIQNFLWFCLHTYQFFNPWA